VKLVTFPGLCGAGIISGLRGNYVVWDDGRNVRTLRAGLNRAWAERKAMCFLSIADYQAKGERGKELLRKIRRVGFRPLTRWTYNPNSTNWVKVFIAHRPNVRRKDKV